MIELLIFVLAFGALLWLMAGFESDEPWDDEDRQFFGEGWDE